MELENMSREELDRIKKEIDNEEIRRIKVKNDERRIKAKESLELIKNNNDLLALLKHDCTSCSDKNPCNGFDSDKGYARCRKCHLIDVLEQHSYGVYDFEFVLDVTLTKI